MRTTITRILVPTDFSATADAALEYACALATRLGASLELLHVIDEEYLGGTLASELYVPEAANLRETLRQEGEQLLSELVTSRNRDHLAIDTAVVVGRSFRTIVDEAVATKADLIVMGTHGRTGIAHLLLGSVAERVVRTAACPVLTVRERPLAATEPVVTQGLASTLA
jgi:nucleotide-binding universal stress UspA family protein